MGRLSGHASAMDIIVQLHASLLCSFLRMAAGEVNQGSPFVDCTYVSVRACVWDNCIHRVCVCVCRCPHAQSACMWRLEGFVCMHVEWHLVKCGNERRNIWLIIEVPWKKYDHGCVFGLRAQLNQQQQRHVAARPAGTRTTLPPWSLIATLKVILLESDGKQGKSCAFKASDPDGKIDRMQRSHLHQKERLKIN